MARFTRTTPAPTGSHRHPIVRAQVRQDFERTCAYCLLEELLAAGPENFELDHFRPRIHFRHLINDFYNLYYCCHPCNKKKGSLWPSEREERDGFRFLDLCDEDFQDHYRSLADGRWEPLTLPAKYTLQHLRLNNPHLVKIRRILIQNDSVLASE
jgi:uncharacterized protein (TIGR02646 family)